MSKCLLQILTQYSIIKKLSHRYCFWMAGSHLLLSEITHTTPRLIRIWFPHFIGWPHKQTHVALTAQGHPMQKGCRAPSNMLVSRWVSSSIHPERTTQSSCAASPRPCHVANFTCNSAPNSCFRKAVTWRLSEKVLLPSPWRSSKVLESGCHVTGLSQKCSLIKTSRQKTVPAQKTIKPALLSRAWDDLFIIMSEMIHRVRPIGKHKVR